MKKLMLCLLPILLMFNGCTEKVLDFRNAEVSSGKVYENGSNEPFTGKLTNLPLSDLPINGIGELLSVIRKAGNNDETFRKVLYRVAVVEVMRTGDTKVACDAQIKDGLLADGDVLCRDEESNALLFSLPFKGGMLDGELLVFNSRDSTKKLAKANYEQGKLSDSAVVYNVETNNIGYRLTWNKEDSRWSADYFNPKTGLLLSHVDYSEVAPWQGAKGEVIQYGEDGKTPVLKGMTVPLENSTMVLHEWASVFGPDGKSIISTRYYHFGKPDGMEEIRDPKTGVIVKRIMWSHGTQDPSSDDFINQTGVFQNGSEASVCVERLMAVYRQEKGNKYPIYEFNLKEWERQCTEEDSVDSTD